MSKVFSLKNSLLQQSLKHVFEMKTAGMVMVMRSVTLAAKFALTIYIAHRMGLDVLGAFGLVSGVAIMAPTVASLGLMSLLARDIVTQPLPKVVITLRNYWLAIIAVYVLALPLVLVVGGLYKALGLAFITLLLSLLEHLNNDAFSTLTSRHRPLLANILFFLRNGCWMVLFMGCAFVWPAMATLEWVLVFWLAFSVVCLGGFFWATKGWPWSEAISHPLHWKWYPKHLKRSWMFLLNDMGNTVGQFVDRYCIGIFLGLEQTGVYVLFWSVVNAVYNLVNTGTMQILRPHLIQAHYNEDAVAYRHTYRKIVTRSMASAVVLGGAAAVVFPFVVQFLNRPVAEANIAILWILFISMLLRTAFDLYGLGLYVERKDIALTTTSVGLLVVSFVANMALLPVAGIYGAALASIVSFMVIDALRHYALTKGKKA